MKKRALAARHKRPFDESIPKLGRANCATPFRIGPPRICSAGLLPFGELLEGDPIENMRFALVRSVSVGDVLRMGQPHIEPQIAGPAGPHETVLAIQIKNCGIALPPRGTQ